MPNPFLKSYGLELPDLAAFPQDSGQLTDGSLCVVSGAAYKWDSEGTDNGAPQHFWQIMLTLDTLPPAGDMFASVYDPGGAAADAFDADNHAVDPAGNLSSTDVQAALLELQGDVDALNGLVASDMTFKGGYDAAANSPDLDVAPSGVFIGDVYVVTIAGTFFTIAVEVGDALIARQNSATLEAHWTVVSKNLDFGTSPGQIPAIGTALGASQTAETDALGKLVTAAKQTGYNLARATAAEINAGSAADRLVAPDQLQASKYLEQSGAKTYATTSGVDTYAAVISPAITSYGAGQTFIIQFASANTGAATLNLNGLGAKPLVRNGGAALVAGDLSAGGLYAVAYDGTSFWLLSAVGSLSLATVNARAGSDFSVVAPSAPRVTTASALYVVLARFIFAGTAAAGALTAIKALFWRISGTGSVDMQIYDVTNALQIAELTGVVGAATTVQDLGAIANLPAAEATFEVQLRAVGAATAAFSSVKLEY